MTTASDTSYIGVKIEGGLLPPSLLERIAAGSKDLKGSAPADYHLPVAERLGDAASRKWLYLRGVYQAFRDELATLPETDPATTQTREHWLQVLLSELSFGHVPFLRAGLTEDDKKYPVSHLWEHVPIQLLGWHTKLDVRNTQNGRAPQSMLQEFLNVSDEHLWGLLSNGRRLRLLRDSKALTGAAYVEFDLEAIFDGELYSDFLLLFALLHHSRFELLNDREDGGKPTLADCWLERWRVDANEVGVRARDRLRDGVKKALEELGTGFMEANPKIREDLASGTLDRYDFRHELLRLAYQLIFVFVTEDRGVLLDPGAADEVKDSYQRYFSAGRLRRIARLRRGDRNTDLWRAQVIVLDALGSDDGQSALGLPGLGGLFFRPEIIIPNAPGHLSPDLLRDSLLTNTRLLAAIRYLDEIRDDRGRPSRVDYRHLGAEELGSIFESLLEVDPQPDVPNQRFELRDLRGNLRKTTGSYYTPRALIDTLLDTTLDPVLEQAAACGITADLLKLRICDPACGSGAFLVAAAQRMAKKYAELQTGEEEPSPLKVAEALHEVIRHCVYGVDINPLAVELAQVSLWLESQMPGKPLAFLDPHVKAGNSLLGVTPKLLKAGIPDGAFKPIEGDDPTVAASLRKQNALENTGVQAVIYLSETVRVSNYEFADKVAELAARPDSGVSDIRQQVRQYRAFQKDEKLLDRKRVADAWCAAFVWRKHADAPAAITTDRLKRLDAGEQLPQDVAEEVDALAREYQFFHWHLEFPDVFRIEDEEAPDVSPDTGWPGGFDCVLGNPPWEKVEFKEEEFFATRREEIAKAKTAAIRKRMIEDLARSGDPVDDRLYEEFHAELRRTEGWSQLLRESDRYPLTKKGRLNTYAVFAETARTVVKPEGRAGLVLPTGIGTDATTAEFFGDVVKKDALAAFLEFENEAFLLNKDVHHSFRFCLLTMCGRAGNVELTDFAFGVRYIADLGARTLRRPPKDLLLVNPNTGTTPLFRFPRDAEITFGIYEHVPVLWRDEPQANPWGISFLQGLFNMATDSYLFKTEEDLRKDDWDLDGNVFVKDGKRMLPLVEAKMIHHFDHRYGTYTGQTEAQANMGTLPHPGPEEKADPSFVTMPRYWVQEFQTKNEEKSKKRGKTIYDAGVDALLESRHWDKGWLLGWRDIARSIDERTVIPGLLPRTGVGHTFPLLLAFGRVSALYANLASFVLDYAARQKIAGTHLTYGYLNQFPVLPPERYEKPTPWELGTSLAEWIERRVLELTYTSWDMETFARDLGDDGPPFVWDEDRRFKFRAELDAAFFLLYDINRVDVDYIMDTFRVVKERDEKAFGGYRTKLLILDCYAKMVDAKDAGEPYRTILDRPAGQGKRHPARNKGYKR
jgi:hypothetical protein